MPIYEYTCRECTEQFRIRRHMTEADSPIVCPTCGSPHTARALSRIAACRTSEGGNNSGGCSGCSGGSCSSCGH